MTKTRNKYKTKIKVKQTNDIAQRYIKIVILSFFSINVQLKKVTSPEIDY